MNDLLCSYLFFNQSPIMLFYLKILEIYTMFSKVRYNSDLVNETIELV